jgi:hypothetical protein
MTLKKITILFIFLIFQIHSVLAQKISVQVNGYQQASIWHNNKYLGVGSAIANLDKNSNIFRITQEGYKDVVFVNLTKSEIKAKLKTLNTKVLTLGGFDARLVKILTEPYDATIYIDGREYGTKNITLEVPVNKSVTLELKKAGFQPVIRTYSFIEGGEQPPLQDRLVLENRLIEVKVQPADAAVYVNDKLIKNGSASVVIPKGECVRVKVSKDGFVPKEEEFCNNQNGGSAPPLTTNFILRDRLVRINTTPTNSTIRIDGKEVGQGDYLLEVSKGACVEVLISSIGYETYKKTYCNQDNVTMEEVTEHFVLKEDEAFLLSTQVDQANIDVTIDVNNGRGKENAWQVLSMIVTTHFDVLEITDKDTGYIRTSWVLKTFRQNTVRTRLIVKQSSISPLQFKIKLQSQFSGSAQTSVKDDQYYKDWDRVLNTYKDILNEAQTRLKN